MATVNIIDFHRLCRDTSVHLGLPDSDALGAGEVVIVDELEVQVAFDEPRSCVQFHGELGDPRPEAALQVYERLLEIQTTFIGLIDAMFVRDPVNERLLFTVSIPVRSEWTAETFADTLTTLTKQVRHWRATVLSGQMIDYEELLNRYGESDGSVASSQLA